MTQPTLRCVQTDAGHARVLIEFEGQLYDTPIEGNPEQLRGLIETGAFPGDPDPALLLGPSSLPLMEVVKHEPDVNDPQALPHSLLIKHQAEDGPPAIYLRLALGEQLGAEALGRVKEGLLGAPRRVAEQAATLNKQLSKIRQEVRSDPEALKKVRAEIRDPKNLPGGRPDAILRIKHDLAEGWAAREREAVLVRCLTQEFEEELTKEGDARETGAAAAVRVLRRYRAQLALHGIEQGELTPQRIRDVISDLSEEDLEDALGPILANIRGKMQEILGQTVEMQAEVAKLANVIVQETPGPQGEESAIECAIRLIRTMQLTAGSSMGFQVVGLGSGAEEVGDLPEALLIQWADKGPPAFYVKNPMVTKDLRRIERVDVTRGREHVEAAQRIARNPNAIPRGDMLKEEVKIGFQEEYSDEFVDADGNPVAPPQPPTGEQK